MRETSVFFLFFFSCLFQTTNIQLVFDRHCSAHILILDDNMDQSYSLFNHYSSSSNSWFNYAWPVAQNKLKLQEGYAFRYSPTNVFEISKEP